MTEKSGVSRSATSPEVTEERIARLADDALQLAASDDPLDVQRAQVYATLALSVQVHEVGRLIGQIGELMDEREGD